MQMRLYGGIEAGGTKFVCAVGTGPDDIRAEVRFPTTEPDETIGRAVEFFRQYMIKTRQRLDGIGIGSFGPLDLNPGSADYGKITSTPKAGWLYTEIHHRIERETATPAAIDTDVNAAALGEGTWGAAVNLRDYIYLTVGTGIGGGFIVQGKPHTGWSIPRWATARPTTTTRRSFRWYMPYHGNCLEGLASGPAIEARTGKSGEDLPGYDRYGNSRPRTWRIPHKPGVCGLAAADHPWRRRDAAGNNCFP